LYHLNRRGRGGGCLGHGGGGSLVYGRGAPGSCVCRLLVSVAGQSLHPLPAPPHPMAPPYQSPCWGCKEGEGMGGTCLGGRGGRIVSWRCSAPPRSEERQRRGHAATSRSPLLHSQMYRPLPKFPVPPALRARTLEIKRASSRKQLLCSGLARPKLRTSALA
jgi:hypothetical protein